ncbi:MAG: arginine--tRNA ligase, partial [Pseudomonadota bacterium]
AGHGRGTVVGDALANLLERAGYDVTREYYINDGGAQIEALARSIYHRYLEELGLVSGPPGEGLYPLEELIPVGVMIAKRDGKRWVGEPEETWLGEFGRTGVEAMMVRIKEDLGELGVHFDVFTSERSLIESGKVDAALEHLGRKPFLQTPGK